MNGWISQQKREEAVPIEKKDIVLRIVYDEACQPKILGKL